MARDTRSRLHWLSFQCPTLSCSLAPSASSIASDEDLEQEVVHLQTRRARLSCSSSHLACALSTRALSTRANTRSNERLCTSSEGGSGLPSSSDVCQDPP